MPRIVPIDSLSDPRCFPYRSLKGKDLVKEGIFVVEGPRAVQLLLQSDYTVISLLMTDRWLGKMRSQLAKRTTDDKPVLIADRETVDKIIGFKIHQGIMAAVKIPDMPDIAQIIKKEDAPYRFLAFDGLKNAENVGAIIRNAAAFHVTAIIYDDATVTPFLRRVVSASAGTLFKVRCIRVDKLDKALLYLKKKNVRIVAASPGRKSKEMEEADLSGDVCIVFGSEGYGISDRALKIADSIVKIPLSDKVDSLNVSCSSAILLYHAAAQKRIPRGR